MEFNIDIQAAFQQDFGLKRPIYRPVPLPVKGQEINYQAPSELNASNVAFQNIDTLEIDTSPIRSSLGSVVISPITFQGGAYKERLNDGSIVNSTFDDFQLPFTSTLEITREKVVVMTDLRGGKGTFKEYIGQSDAKVIIRGILIADEQNRPEQGIRQLSNLEDVPKALSVVCDYLTWVNVSYLVIKRLTFPELKGRPGMQPFQLECISDQPIDLILNGS